MTDIEQARELLAKHMRSVAKKHNADGLRRDAEVVASGEEWDFWMEAAHTAVADALRGAPEGFRLVPVEPTDEMIEAGWDSASDYIGEHRRIDSLGTAWSAMLAVAPAATLSTVTPPTDLRTKLGDA